MTYCNNGLWLEMAANDDGAEWLRASWQAGQFWHPAQDIDARNMARQAWSDHLKQCEQCAAHQRAHQAPE